MVAARVQHPLPVRRRQLGEPAAQVAGHVLALGQQRLQARHALHRSERRRRQRQRQQLLFRWEGSGSNAMTGDSSAPRPAALALTMLRKVMKRSRMGATEALPGYTRDTAVMTSA